MTRMASVPRWVLQHSPAAVKIYALLDLEDGKLSVKDAAFYSDMSESTVGKALKELRDSGAIVRTKNATYSLRREQPLSPESTEFSPTSQHADQQGEAAPAERSSEFSTESEGPTTTTNDLGVQAEGGSEGQSGSTLPKSLAPKRVLIEGRYLAFDALAMECSADPRSRTGEITAALKKIRQYVWDEAREAYDAALIPAPELTQAVYGGEAFERLCEIGIRHRAKLYRERMAGATLTPTALAKWWFDVEKLDAKGLSPEQIARGEY